MPTRFPQPLPLRRSGSRSLLVAALMPVVLLAPACEDEECRGAQCLSAGGSSGCDGDEDCTGDTVCNPQIGQCVTPGTLDLDSGPGPDADAGSNPNFPDVWLLDGDAADPKQPRVLETIPVDGARGVASDVTITVRFSERVNADRVAVGFHLIERDGTTTFPAATYDEDTFTATVVPEVPLKPYGIYTLQVLRDITDYDEDKIRHLQPHSFHFSVAPDAATEAHFLEVATRYAPVVYQDTAGSNPRNDYLTNYDFDGAWLGDEKLARARSGASRLEGAVYFSVIETVSHIFLTYAYYHPWDWHPTFREVERENSMAGARVVVPRAGPRAGKLLFLETFSHGDQTLEPFAPAGVELALKDGVGDRSIVAMPEDWLEEGRRYHAFLTEERHDSCVWDQERSGEFCRHSARTFKNGNGVKYIVADEGEQPRDDEPGCQAPCEGGEACRGGACAPFHYELRSIAADLWVRRREFAEETIWHGPDVEYSPGQGRPGDGLLMPGRLAGDDGRQPNTGEPPWAWIDPDDRDLVRGRWFLDPAGAMADRYTLPGDEPWDDEYCYNAFLGIDGRGEGNCPDDI
jgi:hypothetical protein